MSPNPNYRSVEAGDNELGRGVFDFVSFFVLFVRHHSVEKRNRTHKIKFSILG